MFYVYAHDCGYEAMLERSPKDDGHLLNACPGCGEEVELRPVLNRHTAPNIQLSAVTNHVYNNGMGKYDMGLGVNLESRQQHERVMKEKGLEVIDTSPEDFVQRNIDYQNSAKEIPIDHIKDRYEYYKAEVGKGLNYENKEVSDKGTPLEVNYHKKGAKE